MRKGDAVKEHGIALNEIQVSIPGIIKLKTFDSALLWCEPELWDTFDLTNRSA